MFCYINSNKGLTLIEIIVSIAILSIIITPMSSLFIQSAKTNVMADRILTANNIAQKNVEAVMFGGTTGSSISGYTIDIDDSDRLTGHAIEVEQKNDDSEYDVIITLEEDDGNNGIIDDNNDVLIYNNARTIIGQANDYGEDRIFINITGGAIKIDDYSDTSMADVTKSQNRILIECYDDMNLDIYVKNYYPSGNPIEFQIVKILDNDGNISTSNIDIISLLGEIYQVPHLYLNIDEPTDRAIQTNIVEKIKAEVSRDNIKAILKALKRKD